MKKVLITGGSGFIGRHLSRSLIQAGYSLVIVTRDIEKASTRCDFDCELVTWSDINAESIWEDVHVVITLSGSPINSAWWTTKNKNIMRSSRIGTNHMITEALKKYGDQVALVIASSAISIYGDGKDTLLTESSSYGNDFLARLCQDWESSLNSLQSVIPRFIFVRIGLVIGRDGGISSKMKTFFSIGLGCILGNGKQWLSWIHIDDLVSIILYGLQHKSLHGVINAVTTSPVTYSNFAHIYAGIFKHRVRLSVSAFFLKLVMQEKSLILLNSQRVYPTKLINAKFHFQYTDIKQALQNIYLS